MRDNSPIRNWLAAFLCGVLCLSVPTVAATTSSKKTAKPADSSNSKASTHKSKRSRAKTKARSSKKRGQKAIASERARQIQEALIREHYLRGEPSGRWDDATQAALRRYQADQGWQSKTVPDSRALIKLGLGPDHDHLLNPESAMTTTSAVAVDPKAKAKPRTADLPAPPAPAERSVPPQ